MAENDIQQNANEKYYTNKGEGIYSDFSTFAQGKMLSRCNAAEFVRDFSAVSDGNGAITVCEYGVGNGNFAKVFLDEVKLKDEKLHSRVKYHLLDISESMLEAAKKTLSGHEGICEFHRFDANKDEPAIGFHYCRINELLSDLPVKLYMMKDGEILRLVPGDKMFSIERERVNEEVVKLLRKMDDGRVIPFSFKAQEFLLSLCRLRNEKSRMDIFDYGFYYADDVFSVIKTEWNRLVWREYGGQITADVNFLQLAAFLSSHSFFPLVEKQKKYAEGIAGFPLQMADLEDGGLDYEKKEEDDGIDEDDGFFHLRMEKNI